MKRFFTKTLMISLLFFGFPFYQTNRGQNRSAVKVPTDFAYPERGAVVEIETPFIANSLTGKVVDTNGNALEKVLVERVTSGWKKRIEATFTNSAGHFYLSNQLSGKYYLKFSLDGFGTVLTKIKVIKKTKAHIKMELPLAN